MTRCVERQRQTRETKIQLRLDLDGAGHARIATGIGFLDHMLEAFTKHGHFDLSLKCEGDLHVDEHHTVEDCGIVLGAAFAEAVGDKAGLLRFGSAFTPMDEALVRVVLDLSGRPFLHWQVPILREQVGDLPVELVPHFWRSFAEHSQCTLHIELLYGTNEHHALEAVWKGVGRALSQAVTISPRIQGALSTKGSLTEGEG